MYTLYTAPNTPALTILTSFHAGVWNKPFLSNVVELDMPQDSFTPIHRPPGSKAGHVTLTSLPWSRNDEELETSTMQVTLTSYYWRI